jgi:hypothetical protein
MSGSGLDDLPLIDFHRAYLDWTTTAGSHGRWRVIASAIGCSGEGTLHDRFVLTPLIMAGDVYGTGRLPLDPPYSFQFIGSSSRHAIVRDYTGDVRGKDSAGRNSELFSKIDIHAPASQAGRLNPAAVSIDGVTLSWPLSARLRITAEDGGRWLLDFPVNHANVATLENSPKFQIETGPILVPDSLIEPGLASVSGGFALAYVFFNRLDRADLSLFGPSPSGQPQGRAYGIFSRLSGIAIELYSLAPLIGYKNNL